MCTKVPLSSSLFGRFPSPMNAFDSPASLREALRRVAGNLWFSWLPGARALFEELGGERFAALAHNPTALLAELNDDELAAHATPEYLERVERVLQEFDAEEHRRTWWQRREEDDRFCVAYFCCEFGLDASLPIYSGGLGILAGDHLKSASDLGIPLVGVGLLYQKGYFQQYLNADGWQQELYPVTDFYSMAVQPVLRDGRQLSIEISYPGRLLTARVWLTLVGRVPLYLLDTNIPQNSPSDRNITGELYGGDMELRIQQEILLGIGGIRALRAVGIDPVVCHMNEGHSAFLGLERIRS